LRLRGKVKAVTLKEEELLAILKAALKEKGVEA
jgi:hypothetical protein